MDVGSREELVRGLDKRIDKVIVLFALSAVLLEAKVEVVLKEGFILRNFSILSLSSDGGSGLTNVCTAVQNNWQCSGRVDASAKRREDQLGD